MSISQTLVSLVVCPVDKGELWYIESENILYNPRSQRKFRIESDIPILLVDESEIVDDKEAARLGSLDHVVTGKG
ncbi:Trm112 family protein [Acidithrix sp. C25]|uniref:Trm112 family protein n=1 Tax=Acidithrix sp. C25 TaxID=1671482 RepID=UPI00191BB27A|nr:Trm112 family protein [Acidithrix sp. C25]CAG4928120.1 unnamed protein product [Acidithrix sp. C25]